MVLVRFQMGSAITDLIKSDEGKYFINQIDCVHDTIVRKKTTKEMFNRLRNTLTIMGWETCTYKEKEVK